MSRKDNELYETLRNAFTPEASFLHGEVKEVNKANCTCVLDVAGKVYKSVSLRSIITDEMGVVFYPEIGSIVYASRLPGSNRLIILKMEKVESFHIKINDSELSGDASGFVLKSGNESLKGILSDLMDAISQLTVTTGVGPSGTPINVLSFTELKSRLNNILTS